MKGISPLLAAVLLIAITVAIATLIMGWMSTIARTAQVRVENKTIEAIDCSSATISIDGVYINNNTGTANVIVSNTGQVDGLIIQSAQLFNTSGNNFTSMNVPLSNFDRGDVETLSFSGIGISSCPAAFAEVIVTTNCGAARDEFDTTPNCI